MPRTARKAAAAHAREDYPSRDDANWMKHTLAFADYASKKVTLDERPVHTFTLTNEIGYIEPKARRLLMAWPPHAPGQSSLSKRGGHSS